MILLSHFTKERWQHFYYFWSGSDKTAFLNYFVLSGRFFFNVVIYPVRILFRSFVFTFIKLKLQSAKSENFKLKRKLQELWKEPPYPLHSDSLVFSISLAFCHVCCISPSHPLPYLSLTHTEFISFFWIL